MASNNLEKTSGSRTILVNPSYFAPYSYRLFAVVDEKHDWLRLVDTSYEVIQKSMEMNLDKDSSAGLPPDWIEINRQTGEIIPPQDDDLTSNFSYDALRVPFRLFIDWKWFNEPRAKETLEKMEFLSKEWNTRNKIYASYSHDGEILEPRETPAMYSGVIGYFMITDPKIAEEVYKDKLVSNYDPDTNTWTEKIGYYNTNMTWFGIALYNDFLINLTKE